MNPCSSMPIFVLFDTYINKNAPVSNRYVYMIFFSQLRENIGSTRMLSSVSEQTVSPATLQTNLIFAACTHICSFSHCLRLMTIGEDREVDLLVNRPLCQKKLILCFTTTDQYNNCNTAADPICFSITLKYLNLCLVTVSLLT